MNAKEIITKHMAKLTAIQWKMPRETYVQVYDLLQKSWFDMIKLGMYHRGKIPERLWKSIKKEMDAQNVEYDASQDMGE